MSGPHRWDGSDDAPLYAVRAWVDEKAVEGAICPCCDRYTKVYVRRLNSAMVLALDVLVRAQQKVGEGAWLHLENTIAASALPSVVRKAIRGDATKLRFWGFIEGAEGERDDGNPNNGLWRVDPRARTFLAGLTSVPKHVVTRNDTLIGVAPEVITVRDVKAGRGFDYTSLMNAVAR